MLLTLYIVLGIFLYVFGARCFYKLAFDWKDVKKDYRDLDIIKARFCDEYFRTDDGVITFSVFWVFNCVILFMIYLVKFLGKFPVKLADFACNPQNYKFRVKLERRG